MHYLLPKLVNNFTSKLVTFILPLSYLKLSIVNRNKEDYRVLKLAIKNVFNHLCKQDFYYETNSSKIFETIYIRKTNKKIFQISAIYYMDQKTLYKLKLGFVRMIIKECNHLNNHKSTKKNGRNTPIF